MLGTIKGFLAATDSRIWLVAGFALLLVMIPVLSYCAGKHDGRSAERTRVLEQDVQVARDVSAANDAAADARARDAVTIAEQKKELEYAISTGEDDATLRARRGCLILRQQGRDTSGLASCQRFEAGR